VVPDLKNLFTVHLAGSNENRVVFECIGCVTWNDEEPIMKRYWIASGIGGSAFLICFNSYASYLDREYEGYEKDGLSVSASLGYMGGKSTEYVYYQGRQVSRVEWKVSNTAIIRGEFNYDVLSWLSVNASGWTTMASGSGNMSDYDWQNEHSNHYTDSSFGPVQVNEANFYDVNLRGWLVNEATYKIGLMLGYQESRLSMLTSRGHYDYAGTDDNGNYDPNAERDRGIFPDKPGIGYKQRFRAPYIGVTGKYLISNIELNGLIKYSRWGRMNDSDRHYLNNELFTTKTNNVELWAGELGVGYWVTPGVKIFTEASYTYYPNRKGDITSRDGDGVSFMSRGGGAENRNWSMSAGIQYLW
jgi:plasminogen activator